jgi:hypothetical protein
LLPVDNDIFAVIMTAPEEKERKKRKEKKRKEKKNVLGFE